MTTDILSTLRGHAAASGRVWLQGPAPVTYAELWADTGRMANALAALGVRRGDRLMLQVEKSAEALTLYLACLRAGVVFLPVNPAYTMAETRHFLTDAEPALVLVDGSRLAGLATAGVKAMAFDA
ncbi:MAG: hypothetical protein B7Y02_08630, partial [Rhodobacterales bacterium 17-64-5]